MTDNEIREILENGINMTAYDIKRLIKEGLVIYEDTEEEFQDFKDSWIGGMNDPEEAQSEWEKMDLIESDGKKYRVDFFNVC